MMPWESGGLNGKTCPLKHEIDEYAGEIHPGDPSSIAGQPSTWSPGCMKESRKKREQIQVVSCFSEI